MKNEEQKMKDLRWMFLLVFLLVGYSSMHAQQYTGMSGLIHVPSADMDAAGEARIGVHFLNKEFTPTNFSYHSMSHYLSITPFSWIEIGYTCTLMKGNKVVENKPVKVGYYHKDRYFSVKLQPLKEGKWWPAIAIGANDPYGTGSKTETDKESGSIKSGDGKSQYFCNFYIAASKHIDLKGNSLGFHLACRKWKREYNSKWNGPVGGITFQPSFQKNLRAIAEYTGDDINIGFDWLLWKHLLIQSSLQNGKYFSGGVCFQMNLL